MKCFISRVYFLCNADMHLISAYKKKIVFNFKWLNHKEKGSWLFPITSE